MSIFTGTGVALATPADENGIMSDEAQKLLDLVTKGGVNAIVALGTTGEPSTLTSKTKEDFVRFVRARTTLPLIVGAGGNDTTATAQTCLRAVEWGADALLVVTPFYNKCTQDGAVAHYRYIAERVPVPIIVYNVPSRTGFNLLPDTMARISEIKGIDGIKEASGNMAQLQQCLRLGITVYSGEDALTAAAMSMGAKGVISVVANVAPELMSRMTAMALRGNFQKAASLQLRLLPLIDALFSEVNPIPVRAALGMMGIELGKPRLPMTELSEVHKRQLTKIMEELKLI